MAHYSEWHDVALWGVPTTPIILLGDCAGVGELYYNDIIDIYIIIYIYLILIFIRYAYMHKLTFSEHRVKLAIFFCGSTNFL